MDTNENNIKRQIDDCLELLKSILGEDLLGIYLYGSSTTGGLQKFSDIDLFAVANRETTYEEKQQFVNALLKISGIYSVSKDLKPIELTIVVKSDVNPWQYPPKFDFQYGDWLRKDFESGNIEPWKTKENPNLALIITQLLLSNRILFGPNPNQLLSPIPYEDFINATTAEVDSLMNDLDLDTRNVLLTLSRIWCTLETDTIRSKTNAVSWTIEKIPNEYRPILERAKAILLGEENENWEDVRDEARSSANFMLKIIKTKMNEMKASNYSERSIKIA